MGWYPCCCCPAGDKVLIWDGYSFETQLPTTVLREFLESMGLTVHYPGDVLHNPLGHFVPPLSDYGLIFAFGLIADPEWWSFIENNEWDGTLVLMCDNQGNDNPYSTSDDPPDITWLNGKSALTGVTLTPDLNPPVTGFHSCTVLTDPLTNGVTSFSYNGGAIPSGGTVLVKRFDASQPTVIVRNRPSGSRIQFVVGGDNDTLRAITVSSQSNWPNAEPFVENLYTQRPRPDCSPREDNIGSFIGGVDFSFTTGAMVGTGALEATVEGLSFSVSGVLTDADAGVMSPAPSSLEFSPTAALSATGALVGSSSLTFDNTLIESATGAFDGESSLTFSTSGALLGRGEMMGQSSLTFTTAGTFATLGELSGDSSLAFSPSAFLKGALGGAGDSSLSFTPTARITGLANISGSSGLTFSPSAALRATAPLAGDSSLEFDASAALKGGVGLDGDTSLSFSVSAALKGAARLSGVSSLTFSTEGEGALAAGFSGESDLTFSTSGQLRGSAALRGDSSLSFSPSGEMKASVAISGTSSLSFDPEAGLLGTVQRTASSSLTFSTSAALKGAGRLVGGSTLTFSSDGDLTGEESDICENCTSTPVSKVVRLCGTITNNSCGTCADITGDYTLTAGVFGPCLLLYQDSGYPCGSLDMQLNFGTNTIAFFISIGNLQGGAQFERDGLSAPYNCNTEADGLYTLVHSTSSQCDFSGMTVEVNPDAADCEHCSVTPESLLLILDGTLSNNNCEDCSLLGNTWTLTRDICGDPCVYTYTDSSACGTVLITLTLGATSITGTIEIDGQTHATLSASVSAPYDASALRTLSVSGVPGNMACDMTAVTSATIEG